MQHRYPQPGNEDEFEDFCVRFYRQLLKRGGLVRYAKRGEKQDGIDIIDQLAVKPLFAIQCKHHETAKTIPPQEIKDEVALAESSSHPIDHYIIATTAKKSKNAHDTVLKLNQTNDGSRRFNIEIHFWEDICTRLTEFGKAVADFIVWGERPDEELIEPMTLAASGVASVTADSADETDVTNLYPDINALFEQRKLEVAEHEISKLPDPELDLRLSPNERYAILRLRAKLALEQLQFDESVRLFNLAYDTCPELQQARQNRVLALELSGKHEEAFAEAGRLLDEGINSSSLVSLLVRNANAPADLSPHQAAIAEFISSDEDVNLAIAMKNLQWDHIVSAEDAARRAIEIAPNSAHAMFSRGMVAHHTGMQGEWQHRSERLEEAIRYYSDAISAAERDGYRGLLPEIHTNRGRVRAVLGERDEAEADFRRAVSVSDTPSLYAEAAASFFLHEQHYNSAWEFVQLLDTTSDEAAYLSAVAEYRHSPDDEKRNHITAFIELAEREFDRATEVRFHCVQWAIELRDLELAQHCVPEAFVERLPFQGNTLLAWIALEGGNKERARELADMALQSSSRTADRQEVAVLATLLLRIGDDEKALPLLEHVAIPGVLDDNGKRLVECARRLDRHDILLRICSELRQTNQQDNLMRKLEVQLLSNYLPEKAFALATQFRQFDASYFTAVRNYLAVRLGKRDEIMFDDDFLPQADTFDPEEAYLVVTPLLEVGRYRDAVIFAYYQLRNHFADERAHGQYIWLVLQYGKKAEIPHPLEVVDDASAIRLENLTTGEKRWLVIEDDHPDPARYETASSSPAAQSLLGKRIGDIVDLRGPSVQVQQERVIEIQSKYIRSFQNAMSHFQQRFPGAGTIQSIHMGSGDSFDPTPLIESLKDRREYVKELMEFYHNNLCSLHFLADRLGVNERQLVIGLTSHDEQFVRCVECTPQRFAATTEAGFGANTVVLELSAIVTISRLRGWDHLGRNLNCLVSRATSDRIGTWLHKLTEQEGQPSAYSFLSDDGKMILQDVTPEQLEHERAETHHMLDKVRELCTVKDSVALADLDPKRREQYRQVCGLHSLESISVANDEGALLWTDDIFVALIGELDFGVKRIWTQSAFKTLEHAGRLGADAYSQFTAKLSAWNYIATVWHPQDLIAAGDLCDWDTNAWPLKHCIRLIGTCPLPLPRRARLAMDFLRLLRRSDCIPLKQSAVVQAALTAVGNPRAVQWILQQLDHFFQIDYPSAEFLKTELLYWLRLR